MCPLAEFAPMTASETRCEMTRVPWIGGLQKAWNCESIPRTPELGPRIMILRLVISNACDDSTLQKHAEACCPHSCASVQVDGDVARIVAAWPRMTAEQKRGLVEFALSAH